MKEDRMRGKEKRKKQVEMNEAMEDGNEVIREDKMNE